MASSQEVLQTFLNYERLLKCNKTLRGLLETHKSVLNRFERVTSTKRTA